MELGGDSLIFIVIVIIAGALIFVFPVMTMANRSDDIAQSVVQTAVSELTDKVTQTGKLTEDDYSGFIQKIYATGNTFDVKIEIQHLDENPSKKVNQANTSGNVIGENTYFSVYTSQIIDELDSEGEILLKEGDIFSLNASNNNETIGESLSGFFYKIVGKNASSISASDSGVSTVSGR